MNIQPNFHDVFEESVAAGKTIPLAAAEPALRELDVAVLGSDALFKPKRIEKFETLRWSRAVNEIVAAVISTRSGFVSVELLLLILRNNSETLSFDCATPVINIF